ncbi:MAG TPA: hypothetical protein VNO55_04495 [Polyangia bacterium]|nr:hypothetical protein [Polyangia bacterium]
MRSRAPAPAVMLGLLLSACGGANGHGGGTGGGGGGSPTDGGGSSGTGGGGAGVDADGDTTAGDLASCAFRAVTAARVPLDLVLLVDASGSMGDPVSDGVQTKWQLAREALFRFVRDPGSAGLGLGLQFFPLLGEGSPCTTVADCNPAAGAPPWLCQPQSACIVPDFALDRDPWCSIPDGVECGSGLCRPLGTCSSSGVGCGNVGAACAGGVAGDLCTAQPKTCQSAIIVCEDARYQKLAVDVSDLPGAALPLIRLLSMRRPGGTTPMAEAVIGTLTNLRDRVAAMPGRHAAMIVATDGLPGGCSNQDIPSIADTLYTASQTAPRVPTYVIGVLDAADRDYGEQALGQLARAGNTRSPFILDPNQDLTQKLLGALDQIRNDALPCEYEIPADSAGAIDFGKVNVHFQGTAGQDDIPYSGGAAQCDPARGGWYYDVDPSVATPRRILACDATCNRFKTDLGGKVELRFGCKTFVIP